MLSEWALKYYDEGCSCSQCILRACETEYNIKISDDCYAACEGLYNGLGIGSCCGVLLSAIMAIGIICDNAAYYRIEMAERFNLKFGSLNCCKLKNNNGCDFLIKNSCDILSDIIDKGRKKD